MLYNYRDSYIGRSLDLYGEWAWVEIDYTRQFARGIVLDIGANIGTHTLVYQQTAEQVIAIEPQYFTYQSLVANLALNACENVIPLNLAVGEYCGTTRILRAHPDQDLNFGALPIGIGETPIPIRTIDSLDFRGVGLMKIDVEGSEENVITGAIETIKRERPVLYVEADRKEKQASLLKLLTSLGYTCQWHNPPIFHEQNYSRNETNIFGVQAAINLLCIPKDRIDD